MNKKISLVLMVIVTITTVFAFSSGISPNLMPDVVSGATQSSTPAPKPAPTPKPAPAPAPVPVSVPTKVPETPIASDSEWSNTPSSWAISELNRLMLANLTIESLMNQYDKPINREEFVKLIVRLYESLNGALPLSETRMPFLDTDSVEIAKAYNLGLVMGVRANMFNPNGILTRQEAATILLRELKRMYPDLNATLLNSGSFIDEQEIDIWAKEAVKYLQQEGILHGNGNNEINPKSSITREQAMALVLRIYEKSIDINYEMSLLVEEELDAVSSATGYGSTEEDDEEEDEEDDEAEDD